MAIADAIEFIRDVANKYRISGIYIVGGAVRDEIYYGKMQQKSDIDLTSIYPNRAVELGGLVAGELGQDMPKILHRTGTLNFKVADVDIDFKGEWMDTSGYTEIMRKLGIDVNQLTKDVYSRDFTINSLLKSLHTGKVLDITRKGIKDIKNKVVRTILPAIYVCQKNPLVILRALRFAVYLGFKIDPELSEAMKKYSHSILDVVTNERAEKEVLKMLAKDTRRTLDLLEEYDLINLILPDVFQESIKLSPAVFQEM